MNSETRVQNTKENSANAIQVRCSRCFYSWLYRGKNPYVVSCPYCKNTLTIRKHRVILGTEKMQKERQNKESLQAEKVEVRASTFQSAIEDWNSAGERFSP